MKNCNIAQNIFMDWYIFSINLQFICEVNYMYAYFELVAFEAKCFTSNSLRMVAASFVTKSFSMWLMTILFMPLGP